MQSFFGFTLFLVLAQSAVAGTNRISATTSSYNFVTTDTLHVLRQFHSLLSIVGHSDGTHSLKEVTTTFRPRNADKATVPASWSGFAGNLDVASAAGLAFNFSCAYPYEFTYSLGGQVCDSLAVRFNCNGNFPCALGGSCHNEIDPTTTANDLSLCEDPSEPTGYLACLDGNLNPIAYAGGAGCARR
jgi:hypothetical protein